NADKRKFAFCYPATVPANRHSRSAVLMFESRSSPAADLNSRCWPIRLQAERGRAACEYIRHFGIRSTVRHEHQQLPSAENSVFELFRLLQTERGCQMKPMKPREDLWRRA